MQPEAFRGCCWASTEETSVAKTNVKPIIFSNQTKIYLAGSKQLEVDCQSFGQSFKFGPSSCYCHPVFVKTAVPNMNPHKFCRLISTSLT
jgi:hypothetical protein